MKATPRPTAFPQKICALIARALIVAGFLFLLPATVRAFAPPGFPSQPTNSPLNSWSFYDHTNWTSDYGYAPVSFTNLNYSYLGDGSSLVVDTNVPAWLQYNVYENDGTTNLTVNNGSVTFWFAPNWSSTNAGGTGPGEYGRLFETGSYTTNNDYGWWSIFVDEGGNNLYFAAQTNDLSDSITTYFSVPISWTTNYFHNVVVTYSPTNTALYLDGVFVTNGLPLTVYPGANVLTNGFYIGSDNNGVLQAHGLFNTVQTYDYPLSSNDVQTLFTWAYTDYEISPWNIPFMDNLSSAPSSPSGISGDYDAITGIGNLQLVSSASSGYNGTNAYNVWLTNVTASASNNGTITFTIEGGSNGVPFDVFANSVLSFGTNGIPWVWEGQGYQWNTYTITNIGSSVCFLILGTPQDSDGNGLTDAYELLVSKTNPYVDDQDGAGISDSWQVLLGLNPLVNQVAQPSTRSNYGYTLADWLNGVSGVKTGSVSLDNEGNVLTVSQ